MDSLPYPCTTNKRTERAKEGHPATRGWLHFFKCVLLIQKVVSYKMILRHMYGMRRQVWASEIVWDRKPTGGWRVMLLYATLIAIIYSLRDEKPTQQSVKDVNLCLNNSVHPPVLKLVHGKCPFWRGKWTFTCGILDCMWKKMKEVLKGKDLNWGLELSWNIHHQTQSKIVCPAQSMTRHRRQQAGSSHPCPNHWRAAGCRPQDSGCAWRPEFLHVSNSGP